ncbi:MAG: acyl-[acyl-carrier-protein]--UDP-N-acetylglucosamine O-acyltransferase [Deltaproteobacteria bacterium RIFOXYA12_FULL_58_15]|nr:MAG: acyl-[acyl-carrier-protein]--UDP-N-acetylglucosamine O-acyltransferase [Deltaproteobacteria bacterium RIFOXYA12_FULL_58_15]OGR09128.1 MAG: acyl-[acyl-carrier-protein]--UDP-N-acetylglucosamine O-acyltransferase [Deltaproteobacteria bacterium RIFOXYB12_FULL_58_9]
MSIHPTAIVESGAEIDPSAEIGPYCVIGPKVKIGPDTRLLSHVVLVNDTVIGARNIIHPFAALGGPPQDLKFKGEPSRLIVGDDNVIRESATLNIGTAGGHMETRVGNNCLLMAYSHTAHDCILGDNVILSNSVSLAGHVTVGDRVIMSGMAGVHQFCRIGRNAFVAGGAMVAQDVPPFCIAQGDRAQLVHINIVGLKRAGWSREDLLAVRTAFKMLFGGHRARLVSLEKVEAEMSHCPPVAEMCEFIRASDRGVCPPRLVQPVTDNNNID